ncbi:MAG: metallophosphoesterase [Ferruginibacter sp.]|nr:metallophosphoesterase [Ferruginibacter sp.]
MKKLSFLLLTLISFTIRAQVPADTVSGAKRMVFVSDTQQPMWVEKILLKPNHNLQATADIFLDILSYKPTSLYMLGDVVALGSSNKKWRSVDKFLDSARKSGTHVAGLLGNHEVMGRRKRGERNFDKRFPMNVRTGYFSVTDSVAVVMLNSNFKSLSPSSIEKQQSWYESTLAGLDTSASIKAVIIACHHAPFSNSKVVKSSGDVQRYFVPAYIKSRKAQLFIAGHAHAFEHFQKQGKEFIVIGGGGGLHQPLNSLPDCIPDIACNYKPMFHYLSVQRVQNKLQITSRYLKNDFSGFDIGHSFQTNENGNIFTTMIKDLSTNKK